MASTTVSPPDNFQLQSPLVRLPAEIKHMIYGYCFAAQGPVIDPVVGAYNQEDKHAANLGTALLRTCRRIYHEADRRPLFSQNTFRFTCVDRVRSFFRSLEDHHRALIQDVEVDAKRVDSNHPSTGRDWLHYLAWGGGSWAKVLGSLKEDAPGLKCLRLNFEAWPYIPLFRAELWNLLRSLLLQVRGLERIVVIGASKGAGMAVREPWSPLHYVGGDDVGSDDLVQRMWRVVGEENDRTGKVIRWTRCNGKMYLEVVTTAYLCTKVDRTWPGPCSRKNRTDPWPMNGSCTLSAYENRDSDVTSEPTIKGLNPSAAV